MINYIKGSVSPPNVGIEFYVYRGNCHADFVVVILKGLVCK